MSPSTRAIIHKPYKSSPANIRPNVPSPTCHGFGTTSCRRKKKHCLDHQNSTCFNFRHHISIEIWDLRIYDPQIKLQIELKSRIVIICRRMRWWMQILHPSFVKMCSCFCTSCHTITGQPTENLIVHLICQASYLSWSQVYLKHIASPS